MTISKPTRNVFAAAIILVALIALMLIEVQVPQSRTEKPRLANSQFETSSSSFMPSSPVSSSPDETNLWELGSNTRPSIRELEQECGYFGGEESPNCLALLDKYFDVTRFEFAVDDRHMLRESLNDPRCARLSSGAMQPQLRDLCHGNVVKRHLNFVAVCRSTLSIANEYENDHRLQVERYIAGLNWMAERIADSGDPLPIDERDIILKKQGFYRNGWARERCPSFADLLLETLPMAEVDWKSFKIAKGYSDNDIDNDILQRDGAFVEIYKLIADANVRLLTNILARLDVEQFGLSPPDFDDQFIESLKEYYPLRHFALKCQYTEDGEPGLRRLKFCLHGQYLAHTPELADEYYVKEFALASQRFSFAEREAVMAELMSEGVPYEFFTETVPMDYSKHQRQEMGSLSK